MLIKWTEIEKKRRKSCFFLSLSLQAEMSNHSSIKREDVVTIDELDYLRQKFRTMVQLKIFHPEFLHVVEELLEKEKRWMEEWKQNEELKITFEEVREEIKIILGEEGGDEDHLWGSQKGRKSAWDEAARAGAARSAMFWACPTTRGGTAPHTKAAPRPRNFVLGKKGQGTTNREMHKV